MEDYNQPQPQQHEGSINQDVSFPSVKPKKKNKKLTYIIIAVIGVMILGGGGFFLLSSPKFDEDANPSPTPFIEPIQRDDSVLPSETEAPAPKEIDRASIKVEIQNGTGIPKEASFLQAKLEALGYEDIDTGNAGDQSATTTKVTFSADLQKEAVDEITKELKDIYEKVTSDTSKSQDVDVLIITGKRSGVTSPPKATTAPKASPTATPKASSSPSPSPASTP